MNRLRRFRKPVIKATTYFSIVSHKVPRFGKRSSLHFFAPLLLLLPTLHLCWQKSQYHIFLSPISSQNTTANFHQVSQLELPEQPEPHSLAPLRTRSITVSSTAIVKTQVDVALICHYTNPCCITSLAAPLRSLIEQTLIPTSFVLLHSCHDKREKIFFQNTAKRVLNTVDGGISSSGMRRGVSDYYCSMDSLPSYDQCLLRYLLNRSAIANHSTTKPYRLLISDRTVLEPTAVEKMWMYLNFRPKISSVRSLSFDETSMNRYLNTGDAMHVRIRLPEWNHTSTKDITVVPMMYRNDGLLIEQHSEENMPVRKMWTSLVQLLARGRLLREALYTTIRPRDDRNDVTQRKSVLSLRHSAMTRYDIPPHLYSDLAFYKWSARREEEDLYSETFSGLRHLDLARIATGEVQKPARKRVMFILPWVDMGGSEKAILDLADRMLSMKWAVTFVLTMPNWEEDKLGEMIYANAWLHKALSLTSDVINLVALAPNHLTSKAFRYVLESRRPDVVINSNSRWGYGHSALIRAIVPKALVADYNHMIHPSWLGGGLPRYGANNSMYFDVHFTASNDVALSMEKWIDPGLMQQNPQKVKPCYIGTDPTLFYSGLERQVTRTNQRHRFNVSESAMVILFAGRFVTGKGTDVMTDLVIKSNSNTTLAGNFFFVFVGAGPQLYQLEDLRRKNKNILVLPPAQSLLEMRNYYAMSDVLLLPSINEGIALVLYEAMAAELLVITTDVGGQRELVTSNSGILIPNSRKVPKVTGSILDSLNAVLADPEKYRKMRITGRNKVRSEFTTSKFCDCVIDGLQSVKEADDVRDEAITEETFEKLSRMLVREAANERRDGLWKRSLVARTLYHALTIGIKTYVCDEQTVDQVHSLMRSIRVHYPHVKVLLGNDGPISLREEEFIKGDEFTEEVRLDKNSGISVGRNALVNMTTTKYFLLLDDDHVIDDSTNFVKVLTALERGSFDIVGMRIRNLPGIDELERIGISIPRYVARVQSFRDRKLILCIWNENDGPSVYGMEEALTVDVLHNAFIAKTDVLRKHGWRDELEVNEHMTFFLDAWKNDVRVGYLPSEFIHHRARLYSKCYYKTRFRENHFEKLLDYEDRFFYDTGCGKKFPGMVRRHLGKENGDD